MKDPEVIQNRLKATNEVYPLWSTRESRRLGFIPGYISDTGDKSCGTSCSALEKERDVKRHPVFSPQYKQMNKTTKKRILNLLKHSRISASVAIHGNPLTIDSFNFPVKILNKISLTPHEFKSTGAPRYTYQLRALQTHTHSFSGLLTTHCSNK